MVKTEEARYVVLWCIIAALLGGWITDCNMKSEEIKRLQAAIVQQRKDSFEHGRAFERKQHQKE